MTKLRLLIFIAIILQLPFYSNGQFTRQQAKNLVVNQILTADTGHINVYSSFNTIPNTSTIILLNGQTISLPYSNNWVFFSDDNPYAAWYHKCRYVFVSSSNGDYTIDTAMLYPLVLNTDYEQILEAPVPGNQALPCPDSDPTYASPNPHLHAVLIAGTIDFEPYTHQLIGFDGDLAVIYNTLIEKGCLKENIIVLDYDGNPVHINWNGDFDHGNSPDIFGPADETTINEVFNALATGNQPSNPPMSWPWTVQKLTPEDQLFVYVTDHGAPDNGFSALCLPNFSNSTFYLYSSNEMMTAMQPIQCAQMIFVFNQCNAGTFQSLINNGSNIGLNIPANETQNRIVMTAAQYNEVAQMEIYMTSGHYWEFTYYLSAALRGYYPGAVPWKWGCKVGEFPFETWHQINNWDGFGHEADYNPDNSPTNPYGVSVGNNDGFTQLKEAFNYANCMDVYSLNGYYNVGNPPNYPPFGTPETPTYVINNGFSNDDLFCLNGIAGNTSAGLSSPQTVASRSYLLGGNLNVHSNISIQDNAALTIGVDNAIIDVDPNSSFTTGNPVFKLKLNGASPSSTTNGLIIEYTNNNLDLEQTTFNSIYLRNNGSNLTIGTNSSFSNCPNITSNRGIVKIQNSTFNNSPLWIIDNDQLLTNSATVSGCNIFANTAIDDFVVEDYKNYSITNNTIYGGLYGMALYFSGWGTGSHSVHLVQSNQITNCTEGGLYIYGSNASVTMNHINHNLSGIEMLDNNSQTALTGNQNALDYTGTQEINDCSGIELYASNNCFPYYMRFNAIIDEDNGGAPTDPLMYYDDKPTNLKFDVAYNCWGNNFDPSTDLYANSGYYKPYPTWCPGTTGNPQFTLDEDMYNTGVNDATAENYTAAKSIFQLLVETYPKSDYAKAAMKELFAIEPYVGNDYSGLKSYFLTNDSIVADTALAKLGDFLANSCNVQLQDYSDAVSWYENKIQNSTDPTDSVFAIIDLGHLYLMMDTTGNRPGFTGSLSQYKPKTKAKYVTYRDSLINLLPFPKDPVKRSIVKLQNGQLLQNVPNPSISSTYIYFKLFAARNAEIKIYNSWGQLKQVIPITDLSDGTQKISYNTSNLPAGIYEYSLSINDKRTDTKKMVVIR